MDETQGNAPASAPVPRATPDKAPDARADHQRRLLMIGMAAVAGALSLGLALLRVAS